MQREKVGKIVSIGGGLCRVIVRSQKVAERLKRIPGVEVRADDTEHLGWWIIFPESLRPVIEPAFRDRSRTIVTQHPEQLSLFGSEPPPATSRPGGTSRDGEDDEARQDRTEG